MAFQNLCPPALIYLIFSVTQVVIDTVKGLYNTALIKVWVAFIFTILLNYLCSLGLGIISWFIVFIPFLLMTLVVAILLLMFGLDPATGKIKVKGMNGKNKGMNGEDKGHDHTHHKHGETHDNDHGHHPPAAKDDKVYDNKDDVMNYYDSADTGGGGGVPTPDKETPNQKANRILSKSLLFYSEEENVGPETKVETGAHLDTTKYRLRVSTLANILSGMGESEIASDYQTKAIACINSAKKMKKEQAKQSIQECEEKILNGIINNLSGPKRQQFEKNVTDMYCKENEDRNDCNDRVDMDLWN